MTSEDFNKILERRIKLKKKVLINKAKEYSQNNDRLYNFKRGAEISHQTPIKECWDYARKHLTCVIDMVEGRCEITQHMIDEKIGDLSNYLDLLEALMVEKLMVEIFGETITY